MASLLRFVLRVFRAKAPGLELLDLHEDLLREILLRIGVPADLIRASAACVAFRRFVAEPSFFRRYRAINRPLLLGFLYAADHHHLQPVEAPHPNAPAAGALYRAANFSFAQRLPRRRAPFHFESWLSCDLRDGRVLLMSRVFVRNRCKCRDIFSLNLAVCDPLSQLYLLLPPLLPKDLLASFQLQQHCSPCFEAFLVPSTEEDETSFRVIAVTMTDAKMVVFVFASDTGCWSVGTSTNWDAHALDLPRERYKLERPHLAHGCFFWKVKRKNKLIRLDMGKMELSTHNLPPGHHERNIAITEAGEGKLALFSCYGYDSTCLDYYTTTMQNRSDTDDEWKMMSTIALPVNHRWRPWYFQGVGDGRILFRSNLPHVLDAFPDLAVGDPLYRRYLLLPSILVGQVKEHFFQYFDAVFAPSRDESDDRTFGLIVTVHYAAKSVVLVFNSVSSSWSVATLISWDALCFAGLTRLPMLWRPCSVYGCIYWKIDSMSKLLRLDMNRMEFSAVDLPPDHDDGHVVVVEAGEDRLGMFSHNKSDTFLNYYTRMQGEG
ncbi:hypothetical protein HU200_051535 [Digitaria exilis]|uniref:F-box protein AT5G49610-like beta-propeller domain-containing protein n=1 Tax=Digitaria exilis TaxID=1010633 RepID=A0A835AQA7_9POAL|nr:hypothetical protein HU200_051535 [Digitaria exilis]